MRPSELDPDQWGRLDTLLDAALDLAPDEWPAFVQSECEDEPELRAQLEALLDAHARSGETLDTPASSLGAALVAAEDLPKDGLVGPFRLLREIGRGGMGVIYLAEDTRLGRLVALKALPPYLGIGVEAKQRFAAEARAVSALDHPNIATLYEIDQTDEGQLYMVFAYYDGETLAERVGRGPVPLDEIVRIALEIARGLDAAHGAGIVHRDVKPSNVLLLEDGGVKLLDFGVAKIAGEEATGEGVRLGTVAYMSPEQATGEVVDERTDLWSLGVAIFEMLHGLRPFDADNHAALVHAIQNDRPRPADPVAPRPLATVLGQLLRKSPDDRYRTAVDLIADLEAVRDGHGVAARPAGWTRVARSSRAIRSGVAIVVAVGAAAIWSSTRSGEDPPMVERIAVLPIHGEGDDQEARYFLDGVQAALASELGRVGDLQIVAGPAVVPFLASSLPDSTVAARLGVDGIVRTSLARSDGAFELTASLLAGSPMREIWADTLPGEEAEVYQVAARLALNVATAAGVRLTNTERRRLARVPVDPEANDAVLLGRYHSLQRSRSDLELARRYFERAIAIDSTEARAHSGLAVSLERAATWGLASPRETYPRARELALTALRHDSLLAEGHTALAKVALEYDWDWTEAARIARHALDLDGSDIEAHRVLARSLSLLGNEDEARASWETATHLQSIPWDLDMRNAFDRYVGREFDGVVESARRALDFNPSVWQAHMLICLSRVADERAAEGLPHCQQAAEMSSNSVVASSALGFALAASGDFSRALELVSRLEQRSRQEYVGGSRLAIVHGALGDEDAAFYWLDRAFEERDPLIVQVRDYPLFDLLRGDARFARLLERLDIAEGPGD